MQPKTYGHPCKSIMGVGVPLLFSHPVVLYFMYFLNQLSFFYCYVKVFLSTHLDTDDESVNVLGLVSIIVFYLIVLAIGVWAGWKQKRKQTQADNQEIVMLAGRNIGFFVGVMTMGGIFLGNQCWLPLIL